MSIAVPPRGGRRLNEGSSRCCLVRRGGAAGGSGPALDASGRSTGLAGEEDRSCGLACQLRNVQFADEFAQFATPRFRQVRRLPLVSRRSSRSRSLSSAGIASQCWCRVHATCPTVSAIPSGPTLRNSPSFIHTPIGRALREAFRLSVPRGSPRRIWAGLEGRGSRLEGFERPPRPVVGILGRQPAHSRRGEARFAMRRPQGRREERRAPWGRRRVGKATAPTDQADAARADPAHQAHRGRRVPQPVSSPLRLVANRLRGFVLA